MFRRSEGSLGADPSKVGATEKNHWEEAGVSETRTQITEWLGAFVFLAANIPVGYEWSAQRWRVF